MDLEEIKNLILKKDLSINIINDFKSEKYLRLSSKDKKYIQNSIIKNAFKTRYLPTLNFLIISLLYDKYNTLDKIKRKGVFRYSNYLGKRNIIEPISKHILKFSSDLNLNKNEISYFKSIINLSPFHKILYNYNTQIIKEINNFNNRPLANKFQTSLINTLIAYLDYLFLSEHYPNKEDNSEYIDFYNKEQIAEAVSFIIFLKRTIFGLKKEDLYPVDEDYIISGEINKLLLLACKFKILNEFEIMIEHFSYECHSNRKNFVIRAPSPEIEKSVRFGFIRSEFQVYDDFVDSNKIVSLEDVSKKIEKIPNLEIFKYTESHGIPRFILEIPEPIIFKLTEMFVNENRIFAEEVKYLSYIFKEQFLNIEKLEKFIIKNRLTLFDFLKIKRFFIVIYYLFSKRLIDESRHNLKIVYRSLVPVFKKEQLVKIFRSFLEDNKINDFLDIVTWKAESHSIFDVQYQPFFKIEDYFILPLTIFVHSNTIRNIFASEYRFGNPKVFDDGQYDPISEKLEKAFQNRGFITKKQIRHSYKSGGDIDFIAYFNDILFIAECKKSLLPTSIYELRTLYDNLNKANDQLNLVLEALKHSYVKEEISLKINYDLSKIKNIYTSIVTNNRLFIGSTLWNHPVINVHELENLLNTGIIRTKDGDYSFWQKNSFSIQDFINYLDEYGKYCKLLLEPMEQVYYKFNFDNYEIISETYALNIIKAQETIKKLGFRKV